MDVLQQQLLNGLILGSIYALIALGYTLVYGILGLINFAHGEVVMIGAMVTISVLSWLLGMHLPLSPVLLIAFSLLLAIPVCALLGMGIERFAYRPLRGAPRLAPLITAIGVSIVLQNVAMMIWGRQYIPFPAILPSEPIQLGSATFMPVQGVIVLLSAVLMGALLLLVHRTKLGRAMRAAAQSPSVARLMGVSVDRVVASAFVIGSILAAVAGVMVSANYGQAHAYMGFMLGLKAFSAAVLGGIGNLAGAVVGGLLLGIIESLGAGYIGDLTGGFLGSQYQDVFAFLVLILVLVFRPSGLLGERSADRP
ncbi:MAG: branched-chain amino acid ABC transporter permease [Paraperlucidibaca sp.]|jgi:branched-chain amino acid transport system permease protein|uniref:branched-chain amino acid ABC transporter permease n=1 Tax=Paraperlucidibaca sp. TaxID=2708021 RepID=UPI001B730F1C|nr:branched-chain amino acid ABC transporter permease [Paraperlucidibaca sp.]MBQ0723156.1 branched-chain amino acid ABC transporter permease [Paraperlucidibaca sp.]MBQ0842959.1 branched-chain amino acid ABC transporter permease [Paraperlucidibaca sp.]|tara:strand:- start:606 stop:1535 length:930 start_codon:yes stop_codon:yes gene_type:complete